MKILFSILLSGSMMLMLAACGDSDSKKRSYTDRMAEEHQGDVPVSNGSKTYKQQQPVDTSSVDYFHSKEGAVSGYYAQPKDSNDELPGIIVIHEWWGLNDNIRMMTRRLAGHGYKALAVDLYNGKTADSPDSAHKFMEKAMSQKAENIANLKSAYTYLTDKKGASKVGVIGWCFGGGWSLQTALALPDDIDATVIYYGELVDDTQQLSKLNMPVLGFFGAEDGNITPEKVHAFEDALGKADVQHSIHIYENAGHAFANPSGNRYNKKAAQDAWEKTINFFDENLK